MKEINLEEILNQYSGVDSDYSYTKESALLAMKEACRQTLELAIENCILDDIEVDNCDDHTPYRGPCCSCGRYDNPKIVIGSTLNKESILNSINQIK